MHACSEDVFHMAWTGQVPCSRWPSGRSPMHNCLLRTNHCRQMMSPWGHNKLNENTGLIKGMQIQILHVRCILVVVWISQNHILWCMETFKLLLLHIDGKIVLNSLTHGSRHGWLRESLRRCIDIASAKKRNSFLLLLVTTLPTQRHSRLVHHNYAMLCYAGGRCLYARVNMRCSWLGRIRSPTMSHTVRVWKM
jgi:hypothetical protein